VVDAELILERLGLDVREVPHVDAQVAHLDFAARGLTARLPGTHIMRIIRRDEFDAWLARNAVNRGIEIRESVTVKDVRPDGAGVTVETDGGLFRAQVVVGADGSNGVTRRCILPVAPMHTARLLEVLTPVTARSPKGDRAVSALTREIASSWRDSAAPRNAVSHPVRAESPGPPGRNGQRAARVRGTNGDMHAADHAYLDFFPVPAGIAGYVWDFPTQVQGEPMRCWGIYDANLRSDQGSTARDAVPLRQPLADEMSRHGLDLAACELKGHPVRWFSPRQRVSVPRVLLVGDAAGTDGVFGEGISIALGYGQVAAQVIHAAIESGDFSFRKYRRTLLLSPLGQSLTIRWAITQALYRLHWAWSQKLLWRGLKPLVAWGGLHLVLNWARRTK